MHHVIQQQHIEMYPIPNLYFFIRREGFHRDDPDVSI